MESQPQNPPANGLEAIELYWKGKGKLSTAYWGFGVSGSFILSLFAAFGLLFIVPSAHKSGVTLSETLAFKVYVSFAYVVLFGYQVFVSLLIWRNAHNTRSPVWSDIAKGVVALSAALLLYQALKQILLSLR